MKLRARAHALIRRAAGVDRERPRAAGKERNHNEPPRDRDRDL